MRIKIDENKRVKSWEEIGNTEGYIEINGNIPKDFRKNPTAYRLDDNSQLVLVNDWLLEINIKSDKAYLRKLRDKLMWSIYNRNSYDIKDDRYQEGHRNEERENLTEEQKLDLKNWRDEWRDITNRLENENLEQIIESLPQKPEWMA